MKKILLLLMVLFSTTICYSQKFENTARTLRIRTYESGVWSDWSRAYPVNVKVVLDVDACKLLIYSSKTQRYKLLGFEKSYYDYTGGVKSKYSIFDMVDQDGDFGTLVLRTGEDWMQIYVQFADIEWIYYLE